MNKGKSNSSGKNVTKESKAGELFPSSTVEEYAKLNRDNKNDNDDNDDHVSDDDNEDEDVGEEQEEDQVATK